MELRLHQVDLAEYGVAALTTSVEPFHACIHELRHVPAE
jgi:hypothetical protein